MKLRNADSLLKPAHPRSARGLTLVEVMVTMVIFVILATGTIMAIQEIVKQWSLGERRRVLHEKAAGVLDVIADDIRLAVTQEPTGVTELKAKLIGDIDLQTKQQRLMFVRSFESGPERAITFNAGDGITNEMRYRPQTDSPDTTPAGPLKADGEDYTGLKVGDFKALGGMAMIGYFASNQTLYRVIRAPVPPSMSALLTPGNGQVLATDVLYLGFDYWSQNTRSWEEPKKNSTVGGPEKMWDSTRAITAAPLKNFSLHRGQDSAADMDDDVFPQMIRVTVTVDSSMPRCVYTKLDDGMGDNEIGNIYVASTRGFPDPGPESFILIDDEWMHYKAKTEDSFEIDRRGARNTRAVGHKPQAVVRTGKTFRRIIYVPNWREDLESDEAWRARKDAQFMQPATKKRYKR